MIQDSTLKEVAAGDRHGFHIPLFFDEKPVVSLQKNAIIELELAQIIHLYKMCQRYLLV